MAVTKLPNAGAIAPLFLLSTAALILAGAIVTPHFPIEEATVEQIQQAFAQNQLTSKQLVNFYFDQIRSLNPLLRGVLEVNPDALRQAEQADRERAAGGLNPYVEGGNPCGSSSGSAVSVAANMVAVSLGTETDGSILCPADRNSVVGIKPTVGLTSRAGVIPISPRQDTIGPICRTVSDAVYVLEAIVGYDPRDHEATKEAAGFVPCGGYKQFLKRDGLRGKRIGVVRSPFLDSVNDSTVLTAFELHLEVFRRGGATVVDHLEIAEINVILDPFKSGEVPVLMAEFKVGINQYLEELVESPVRSLADIIAFNINNPELENMKEYAQDLLVAAETTNGIGEQEVEAMQLMENLSREGFEGLMKQHKLDAMVTFGADAAPVLAMGGYPAISVPAGYDGKGSPFGIAFGGLKGTEPKLIEVAYAFEQATNIRRPPSKLQCEI
ncbi:unnamed protein product [Linum tenue]|uniref:Amidase domain-containing protein n=1 Tax=Linum tenue TaxID=586396 RepID=A0AAV0RK84_9ROSI|nr:unnamed protein product [Linum tenue]